MKKNLLIITGLLFFQIANAQKSLLFLDEHNKYVYYQVIDLAGISVDSLNKNAAYFIKTVYPKVKVTSSNTGGIGVSGKFLTYNAVTFVKSESGEIDYTLNIECKDAKYRYWVTDFIFKPYKRDRYGAMTAEPGIELPLETALSKLEKKEFNGYLDQTGIFCKQLSERLKQYMIEGSKEKKIEDAPTKKIVTDKW